MSKTVKEHLITHERNALIRAGLFAVLFGLPLLLWSLKMASQKAASEIIEPQRSYLSYLLLKNDLAEIQRSINAISYSETIQEVILTDVQGKTISSSIPKTSRSIYLGSDSINLNVGDGASFTVKWKYQTSWTVILLVASAIILFGLGIVIFLRSELYKVGNALSHPIEMISSAFRGVSKVQSGVKVDSLAGSGFKEIDVLEFEFSQLFQRLNDAEKRVVALAQQEVLNKVATQVAHDIRSPLSSLNVLASDAMFAAEKKEIFQNAISRINDIANDLLAMGKNLNGELASNLKPVNVTKIVEDIVLEKKTQLQDNKNIELEMDNDSSAAAWSRVNAADFARIISNLINNSVEALIDSRGKITVGVRVYTDNISVFVQDNGRGMTGDTIEKLGKEPGFSAGKDFTSTGSGNGLGTFHAFSKVREWGGKIEVFSKPGEGTVFNIQLAREKS